MSNGEQGKKLMRFLCYLETTYDFYTQNSFSVRYQETISVCTLFLYRPMIQNWIKLIDEGEIVPSYSHFFIIK